MRMHFIVKVTFAILLAITFTAPYLRTDEKGSILTAQSREESVAGVKSLIDQTMESGYNSNTLYMIFMVFFAGVLTSFTPCIYPMIPITIGILQSQASPSLFYNFLSSFAYVLGIALVYSVLGYLAATTSIIFGQWLGNPFFILFVILFFLYFAFAMFGFYDIYIPPFLRFRREIAVDKKGTLLHCFLFGVISGTVASPCLTPALALVLGLAAKTANPVLGFLYLFAFSVGMGVLLVLVGTFSSTLSLLPQAGDWMDEIKRAFGFVMLAICVYFLEVFIPREIALELYSLIVFIASIYYFVSAHGNKGKIIMGILLLLVSAVLLASAIKLSLPIAL